MAKSTKSSKQPIKIVTPMKNSEGNSVFIRVEKFLDSHHKIVLSVLVLLCVLFTALLFNFKISEANDDALYIEAAYNFSKNFFGFYTAYAPLYPMLLSIVVKLFGINLLYLKLTSVIFTVLNIYFFYRAFFNRVPGLVLFPVLLIVSINSYFLYYSSMTFTEQFFMFLQSLFCFMLFKIYDSQQNSNGKFYSLFIKWMPLVVLFFIITMTRNLAIGVVIPLVVFLLINKKYIASVCFITGFIFIRVPFEFFRKMMWGEGNQFTNQVSVLIKQKDPYDVSKGYEDFAGFVDRFTGNYSLYISKRFYQILGFLDANDSVIKPGLGFIFFVVAIISAIVILRSKNKYLQFLLLYVSAMVAFTFIAIQTRWDQYRLILVFVPMLLLMIFYSFYKLLDKAGNTGRLVYFLLIGLLVFSSLGTTISRSVKNYPIVKKNFGGDLFYGYTTDWANYLKMSKYCGDSLPKESFVACRKAPMSFIYANGKEFFPVYQVFSTDPDTVLSTFQQNKVTHVILASIRRNPNKIDGFVINTLHRVVGPLSQKYPDKLKFVKQIGETEPAYLYEINY